MRTTLTLDEDVASRTKALAAKSGKPFKTVVNEALRIGLDQVERPVKRRKYRTRPRDMGVRPGTDLDNIQGLLSQVEGEDLR